MSDTISSSRQAPGAVLQVVPALAGGGAEKSTLEICAALAADNWRCVVASAGGPMVAAVEETGARHVLLPMQTKNPARMAVNAVRLAGLIRREGVGIVHVRSRAPAWSTLTASRLTGVPMISTWHGRVATSPRIKVFYQSALSRGRIVIANSDYTAGRIRAAHPERAHRLITIPRGVDVARFDPARVSESAIQSCRAEWEAPPQRVILLMPARLVEAKGHLWLLEAMARMPDRKRLFLVCMGDHRGRRGEAYVAALRERIRQWNLEECVCLAGPQQAMVAAYGAADLVAAPSLRPEGFGRVALEAQAMARPVIVADHGGQQESVRPETGWRVAPGDVAALTRVLEEAVNMTPAARAAMGAQGRAWVADRFPLAGMCAATLSAYRRVLQENAVE